MVHLLDRGSVFDAPMGELWNLMRSRDHHRHASMIGLRATSTSVPNGVDLEWEADLDHERVPMGARLTLFPPLGFTMEYSRGPFAGSVEFEYYTPLGDQTGITVVGEYRSDSMDDRQLRAAVSSLLTEAFIEDEANLVAMRRSSPRTPRRSPGVPARP